MKLLVLFVVEFFILFSRGINGNHFLGGTITWKPLNESATGTPVAIVITQTYLFNYTAMQCSNAMIMNNSFVPNYLSLASEKLECVTNCATGAGGYTNISVIPRCTDFSVPGVSIVGQRSDIVYLQSGADFSASFIAGYWRSLATVTNGYWSISTRINVKPRSDNGLYNNAPVATMMSPINLPFNKTVAIQIPVADADGDTVRCRWANKSNGVDECNSVCPPASLPPNTILLPNCTILITGRNISDAYAVAVVVEDFINSTGTTPLSSVPVQFLVQVINVTSCVTPPEVIGIPPEDSCTPVIVGQTYSTQLIAINHCGASVAIDDIATLSFAGVVQSNITKRNSTTFYKSLTWTPTAAQLGYQVMCAMAVDSQDTQSSQYCFSFYVSANSTTDCPGKITLTTYISTTSSTTTTSTTSTRSTTSTTSTRSTTSTTTTTSSSTSTTSTTTSTSSTSSTTTSTTTTVTTSSTTSTSTTTTTTATTSSTSSTTTSTATTSSTSSTSTTTQTTSSTSTSSSSTSTSTTSTTTTSSTSSTSSTTSISTTSSTSTTTSTSSSSSSTSSSSTSTSSTSTSSTSSTSSTATTATIASTTVGTKKDPFNWPVFGIITGIALLAALALCCCLYWCYLWPLIIRGSKYKSKDPVLYHIEHCTAPECYGWDRSSPTDVPLGRYMNLERLRSHTSVNRTLSLNTNSNEMSASTSRHGRLSFLSSNASSHTPLVHVSVSRIGIFDREGTIGNARIQPPTRQVADDEIYVPRRRSGRAKANVIVSRIKSSQRSISDMSLKDTSSARRTGSHRNRNPVQITRVVSLPTNTTPSAFDDDVDSKSTSQFSKDSGRILRVNHLLSPLTTIESRPSTKMSRLEVTFEKLRSRLSRTPAKSAIHVERVPSRKGKARRQQSVPVSSISKEIQKRTIRQHATIRVERLSRIKTS